MRPVLAIAIGIATALVVAAIVAFWPESESEGVVSPVFDPATSQFLGGDSGLLTFEGERELPAGLTLVDEFSTVVRGSN